MSPASRVAGHGLSPIRRMSVGAPEGAVSLALGEPGWELPVVARRALESVGQQQGTLPYGPNAGDPTLVGAILARAAEDLAGPGEPSVMVTSGSQAALFALFQAHVDPGTTVLVPDPGFVAYATLARLCGAMPVTYPLGPDGDLDAALLRQVLDATERVSLVVLNHPANPTGGLATPHTLREVAAACAHVGALLLSDEVYRELWLDEPVAGLHEAAGLGAGVVLGSVSKAWGAPGLRVGWAVGTEEALAPARLVHNAMTTAPARPSQTAAAALLAASEEVLPAARAEVARRWAAAREVAPELLDRAAPGRAGFYLWLPVPEWFDLRVPADSSGTTPTTVFALRVRDEGLVTTVPGDAFGPRGAGHLRVSLGGPVDELEEGLRRLAPWWDR